MHAWWSQDVWVSTESDRVWARFDARNERLMQQAKSLPVDRFRLSGHWLVRDGQSVAEAALPELHWQPIRGAIEFQLPWIGSAGSHAQSTSFVWQLVRGGTEAPIAGAIVPWCQFQSWVETAPQWRLSRLRYCVMQRQQTKFALTLGTPVPPLEAEYLVARQNILTPAGWQWLPKLDASCVLRSFGCATNQWLLWRATDDWYLLEDQWFVPLRRTSVRSLPAQEQANG